MILRVTLVLILTIFALDAQTNKKKTSSSSSSTLKKIDQSNKAIKEADSNAMAIRQKLQDAHNNLTSAKRKVMLIDGKLAQLSRDYVFSEEEYNQIAQEVSQYERSLKEVSDALDAKHKALIALSAKQLSLNAAIRQMNEATKNSVIASEYYEKLREVNERKIAILESQVLRLQKIKLQRLAAARNAQNTLSYIKTQRVQYASQKQEQLKQIDVLNAQEDKYKKQLSLVAKRQDELRATLAKLNILKQQEAQEAKRQAEEQMKAVALENERKKKLRADIQKAKDLEKKTGKKADIEAIKESSASDSVKKVNSSYKAIDTSSYNGSKTISPIEGASLVKRFGTYIDPIYKIKIFNESITLQAPSSDAPVVSVLDGKVVYAGNSSMLGKVVVIAHVGNIHTVYAGLSKIPPTIKAGTAVSKGYTIGKVDSRLMFETTKNSRQFDPLELITL